MSTFETSATVEEQGRVLVAGVPFAPGTQVEVSIRQLAGATDNAESATLEKAGVRISDLFARVRARNTEPVGPLLREELHDRKVLR